MKVAVAAMAVLLFLTGGKGLRCPSCYSRESLEVCNEEAVGQDEYPHCKQENPVCARYEKTLPGRGSVFLRTCMPVGTYEMLQSSCEKKDTSAKRRGFSDSGSCRIGHCTEDGCFA